MTDTIEVYKSLLSNCCVCYTINVSDIYHKIENIDKDIDDEIRICFMQRYLNIFIVNHETNGESITFKLTEESILSDNLEKVDIDQWWIRLCWKTFLSEHEAMKDKVLLLCGKPNVQTITEIIVDLINNSNKLICEEKYTNAIELLKTGLKYDTNEHFCVLVYNMSCVYSLLRDEENMFHYLDIAIEYGYNNWKQVRNDPDFEEYYSHPNFIAIIDKMQFNSKSKDVKVESFSC